VSLLFPLSAYSPESVNKQSDDNDHRNGAGYIPGVAEVLELGPHQLGTATHPARGGGDGSRRIRWGSRLYGADYGDVEFPSQALEQQVVDEVLGIGATTGSMTGSPLPAPSSVTVSVVNGSGVYNQATDTSTALAALGFHTVGVGDTPAVGDVAETVVYYGSRSAATESAAESVTAPFQVR
jgi:LytR cell envelope-related transcriptional attenuator